MKVIRLDEKAVIIDTNQFKQELISADQKDVSTVLNKWLTQIFQARDGEQITKVLSQFDDKGFILYFFDCLGWNSLTKDNQFLKILSKPEFARALPTKDKKAFTNAFNACTSMKLTDQYIDQTLGNERSIIYQKDFYKLDSNNMVNIIKYEQSIKGDPNQNDQAKNARMTELLQALRRGNYKHLLDRSGVTSRGSLDQAWSDSSKNDKADLLRNIGFEQQDINKVLN